MLLDRINLAPGPCGGGKWPGDEAKAMPCTFMTLSVCKTQYHKSVLTVALYTCLWYKLDPDLE